MTNDNTPTIEGLDDLKKLSRFICYFLDSETDKDGNKGFVLTVFHRIRHQAYSDKFASMDMKKLQPLIDYLDTKGVERSD